MATLAPFDLTYVRYQEGDLLGEGLALITLCPIFAMVMYATLVAFKRDMHTLFLLAGQVANLALNLGLKLVLNEKRPTGSDRKDPGMPSNHSQFMAFFAAYCCLFLFFRVNYSSFIKAVLVFGLVALSTLVAISRVYLGYHTTPQVVVGHAVGFLFGVLWYVFYAKFGVSLCRTAADLPLFRIFYFKDYSIVSNALEFEYESLGNLRKSLQGKKTKKTK